MNEADFRKLLAVGLDGIERWECSFRPFAPHSSLEAPMERAIAVIDELVERLHDNYPFFHPDYAGQMLRPPHQVALAAYALAARLNPNNHALDGGPATAALERECIEQIAAMFGLRQPMLGHLTTSGTLANLEALWIAARVHPGKRILFSSEAHYTHARMCELLGVQTVAVPVDAGGRMDCNALAALPEPEEIGTVVVTSGTPSAGAVDRIDAVLALARERGWRVHADAAYGGFFAAIAREPAAQLNATVWEALGKCDSITVDPHKYGLQPYGCGAILFADPSVGKFYRHDSPYTYFTSRDLHLGEISLECSRAGAAAAALWATLRLFPLTPAGLGPSLLATRRAALTAAAAAVDSGVLQPVIAPELGIVTYAPLRPGESTGAAQLSRRSESVFAQCEHDATPIFLAKWYLPRTLGELALPQLHWDAAACTVLRSVLMKPEHEGNARSLIERIAVHARRVISV